MAARAPVEALMVTSRILTAVVSRSLAEAGSSVTTPQLRVLVMLSTEGPLNLTAVAQSLGVNPSNASRTCDQLVEAGLVVRREDSEDRRSIALSLSPSGENLVERLMAHRRATFKRLVSKLGASERAALTAGLDALNRAASTLSSLEPDGDDEDHLLRWLT